MVLRIALLALRRNRMRSTLTVLGIIIGVAAVIAMVAVGQGARASVQAQIASLGSNLIMIFAGNMSRGGVNMGLGASAHLTEDDARAIQNECPSVAAVSPMVRAGAQVVAGDQNWSTSVQGVWASYPEIREWPVDEGTFFTDSDVRGTAKVCVIGRTVADNLFGGSDPVGQVIRIRQMPFRVLGVLLAKGTDPRGNDQDDIIMAPLPVVQKRMLGVTYVNNIMVSASSSLLTGQAISEITSLLHQRHHIGQGEAEDFTVRSQAEIASAAETTSGIMTMLLGSIAGVSLLVGGIGIMNIMLVSVTERTREIGIRLAVGAQERDIMFQFLFEAAFLSVLGGIIGVALGLATSKIVSQLAGWPTLVSAGSVAMSLGFAALVGVFFGFYPARKASRLDPIEALRYE
ncbi:MAG TPA: ABC transporter permease [Candidatus Saccharimonadales bacterium]|nr:ABC transporter permease [Candidatus Saccharimonadales bacterium]